MLKYYVHFYSDVHLEMLSFIHYLTQCFHSFYVYMLVHVSHKAFVTP